MMASFLNRFRKANFLFLSTVVAPTFLAIVYFLFVASDVYVSESRFVVRSPEKPMQSGLGVILQTAGISSSSEEVFAAKSYIESRDGLEAVNRNQAFEHSYTRPGISIFDRFDPLGNNGSLENLYKYYLAHVSIQQDSNTSISTLTVRAYTPQDAQRINRQLIETAEATVNRINTRAREDMIRYARIEVENAKNKAQTAALSLAAYRNRAGVVDPQLQATAQLQMVSKLQDQLIALKTDLRQLRTFTPSNPRIPVLARNVQDLKDEISQQMRQIVGGGRSLAATSVQYERLTLESQFADKQLAGALASLEQALNEARRQKAYVERIVEPDLPDASTEPRRWRGVLATLLLGLVFWGISSMLFAGVREHGI